MTILCKDTARKGSLKTKSRKFFFINPESTQAVAGGHLNAQLKGQLGDVAAAKIKRAPESNTAIHDARSPQFAVRLF